MRAISLPQRLFISFILANFCHSAVQHQLLMVAITRHHKNEYAKLGSVFNFKMLLAIMNVNYSRFCIIRNFLPNRGRILPALKKKSKIKKLSLPRIEPTTSRSSVPYSANCASKESVGKEISEVTFVSYTSLHVGLCSFLESIEHDFMKALMIDTDNKIVT